ncbi:sensor histidine kinase [sulfur-oxidizing endosymbiont of Gigantopelta aegis]|uniref:sensor histidine kinase n=1 Tax=sulfur-oxidizing endosymbiont of Gigantopelta aegis TaxID=2794934 RepID=UPI0018DD2C42|nr:HAMP domain-containing sensor histidine kinase [sulfur-oxidizing endosymbiont of Gigantopelta aegis]
MPGEYIFRSLYARLASILVLIILTMGFVYGFITYSVTSDYLQETTQQFNRELAKKLVGERAIVVDGKINRQALKQTFHDYMTVNPNIEIYLLDLKGKVLSYSADPGIVKRESVSLEPIQSFFQGKLVPGDDPRSFTMKKAFSVTHVPTEEAPEGYLYIVLRGEEYDQVNQALQNNYVIQYSLYSLLISLGVGLLLGLLLFYTITRRVRNLSIAMRDFSDNGFSAYPDPKLLDKQHKDEIGYLARSFDVMAEHTIAQLSKLEEQDKLRRELVANISHDLRTPLASMLGYLETLTIKGESLDAQSREDYLKIVSQHGKRLSRLIDDLFELAKFDAKEITPKKEIFSFSEFIFDSIQKFQHRAKQGEIKLQLNCPREALLVNADIALIERFIDNLLANAFNYTQPGDMILVNVSQQGEEIQIRIRDTGCGISEKDLPKVFDRFYQADNKHRKGKHAGLGLAIVKRIVALHERQIIVNSTVGEGTEFCFSLLLVEQ